jgi:hypothetical protein
LAKTAPAFHDVAVETREAYRQEFVTRLAEAARP